MITLTETTITIAALVFIVILIILARINRQIDNIVSMIKFIARKIQAMEETLKWTSDSVKDKFEKITKKLEKENEEIDWK
ncbi:MAG: hypothetical protein ACK4JE_01900 [Endomicrobiia bacterium]